MKTKFKEFFNNRKGVFVGVTVLMWLATFGIVISGKLAFEMALASLGSITTGVIALYQWYSKEEAVKLSNKMGDSLLEATAQLVKATNDNIRLKKANTKLRKNEKAKNTAIKSPTTRK